MERIEREGQIGAKVTVGTTAYEVTFATAGPTRGHIRVAQAGKVVLDHSLATEVEDNFRRYIKFAADYDQGNLNHVGGGLTGVAGINRWRAMGSAGIRPKGDDHFKSAFEPWRDWKRYPSPGYMFLYTYWMDMKGDRDGNYYGNMMGPADDERIVLKRDKWYCLEHMIQVDDPGEANGELAAWIDGKLYIHYTGFRWRSTPEVKLKRFGIGVYVHNATKDNTVWCDDVALSTGYIGPLEGNR